MTFLHQLFQNYLLNIYFSQLIVYLSDLRTGSYQFYKAGQAEISLLSHFFKINLFGQNHKPWVDINYYEGTLAKNSCQHAWVI